MVGTGDGGRTRPRRDYVDEGRVDPGGPSRQELDVLCRDAFDRLDLDAGEAVLDVQCGRGANFDHLWSAVGPDGRVLGIEFFPESVERARAWLDECDWDDVALARADVTEPPVRPGSFDAAVATQALGVVPDVRAAVEAVYAALRPGGRLAVVGVDWQAVDAGSQLVRLVERVLGLAAGVGDEAEVLAAVRDVFDGVEVVPSPADRPEYAAVARKEG